MVGPYKKFIVAVVGAGLVALNTFLGIDIALGAEDIGNVVITVLTAFGVFQAPNEDTA